MENKLAKLKGMTPELQAKFEALGIKNTSELLSHTATEKARTDLAHNVGTTPHVIKEFWNRADLMRLKGIGGDMSNLLEEAGINSCKELRHRKADNLHKLLAELQAKKKIAHHTPTEKQLADWIEQAKALHGE